MLVTGVGGMVGSYVQQVFSDFDLMLTDLTEPPHPLDIRDPQGVMRAVMETRPNFVLHLAAATDVDRCEQDPDWAFHTNAIGTHNVALACQASGAIMIYISTAGVFFGDQEELYTEFDEPRPSYLYGRSKLAGEQAVTALLSRYYIVRAGWMLGGGRKDKKFVGKIARLIAEGKNPLRIINDKWGTPTYAKDLLRGIRILIGTGYYGVFHMANQGKASRYDMALVVRDALNRPDVEIVPISSDQFPLPAPRPRSEAMRNFKLECLGLHTMRSWQEALREYVQEELAPELLASGVPEARR